MSRILRYVAVLAICFGVMAATCTPASQEKLPKKYTETITTKNDEKISFEMVFISGGTFMMGSPAGQANIKDYECPQHKVRLDPFYLCTTEATIELFLAYYEETVSAKKDPFVTDTEEKKKEREKKADVDAITGPTPVYGELTMGYGKKHPAIGMTWHNAMTFCKWLSKKTHKQYRLPTEAEWEYASRAGSTSVFGFGDDPKKLKDYAWYEDTADFETNEVAKKKPNAWGLFDMLGNVREWVFDFYSPTAYKETAKKNPVVNPKGPKTGQVHVARGGDYNSSIDELSCSARGFEEKWWRSGDPQIPKSKWWLPEMDIIGLRVARTIETPAKN